MFFFCSACLLMKVFSAQRGVQTQSSFFFPLVDAIKILATGHKASVAVEIVDALKSDDKLMKIKSFLYPLCSRL